jgi:RNA polymerase subunit RPABC4/transcription elongation factor Spt4
MEFGTNPLLIILILGFVLLLFVGSFFIKKKQSSVYSEMFPDKKRRRSQDFHRKLELKIERTPEKPAQKNFKEVNLNFKYRKSLINKCENCGMLITGYRKNCPTCGQAIQLKEIVKKCKNCGMLITKSVKICPICRKRTT